MPDYKNASHLAKFKHQDSELGVKLTELAKLQAKRSLAVAKAKEKIHLKYAERITELQHEITELYRHALKL